MVATASASNMTSVVDQLKSLATDVPKNEKSRKELFEASRSLTLALESPGDTIQRICYLVGEQLSPQLIRATNSTH